jgi:hypothetical protein
MYHFFLMLKIRFKLFLFAQYVYLWGKWFICTAGYSFIEKNLIFYCWAEALLFVLKSPLLKVEKL